MRHFRLEIIAGRVWRSKRKAAWFQFMRLWSYRVQAGRLQFFWAADIFCIVNFGSAVGTDIAGIFKHLLQIRMSVVCSELADVKITMFFRVVTAPFRHN